MSRNAGKHATFCSCKGHYSSLSDHYPSIDHVNIKSFVKWRTKKHIMHIHLLHKEKTIPPHQRALCINSFLLLINSCKHLCNFLHYIYYIVCGNPQLKPQQMRFCSVPPSPNRNPQTNHSDSIYPRSDSKKKYQGLGFFFLAHHGLHYLIGVILVSNFRQIHDLLFGRLMDDVLYYKDGTALCKDRNIISQSL